MYSISTTYPNDSTEVNKLNIQLPKAGLPLKPSLKIPGLFQNVPGVLTHFPWPWINIEHNSIKILKLENGNKIQENYENKITQYTHVGLVLKPLVAYYNCVKSCEASDRHFRIRRPVKD